MEPADQRQDDSSTISQSMPVRSPQWSPPTSGGMTHRGIIGIDVDAWAAMEPADQRRDDPGGLRGEVVQLGAAMEPADQRRDDWRFGGNDTPGGVEAAMEPADQRRDDA